MTSNEPPSLEALIVAAQRAAPDELPALVREHAERLGASTALLYVVDLDQRLLIALPHDEGADAVTVDGTLAGRCFRSMRIVDARAEDESTSLWVPVLDGTERIGVLHLHFNGDRPPDGTLLGFAGIVAELVVTKSAYGDYFACARRREPLTVGSELLWQLLPPLTFAGKDVAIAAGFVPTARLGGDAFDYGINGHIAEVAIFDALGHDLEAGLLATTAVAAFRNARRAQADLPEAADLIGTSIEAHFDASKFVTGIAGRLDGATGRWSSCSAGHHPPLLIRNGRVVKPLDAPGGQPFGVGPASPVLTEQLEPGDQILLYTDGVTEARAADGEPFGLPRLVDLVARASQDHPAPEVIRLLLHAVEAHGHGPIRDDATVVLIEWRGRPGAAAGP